MDYDFMVEGYDFMVEGLTKLVANRRRASYGPNDHASSDHFGHGDLETPGQNAATAAASLGLANSEVSRDRSTRDEVEALIAATDLEQRMRMFGVWESWMDGTRGRSR